MYTLRRISSDGVEINQLIGSSYTLIRKSTNNDRFNECLEKQKEYVGGDGERIFAFISFDVDLSHGAPQPLYSNQQNYVMNPNGGTFAYLKAD
tara:strand:- start:1075 stop:1353 length:279 start_codon:yes stop_codon:yes gene_type:complete